MMDPNYSILIELAKMVTNGGGWALIYGIGIGLLTKLAY